MEKRSVSRETEYELAKNLLLEISWVQAEYQRDQESDSQMLVDSQIWIRYCVHAQGDWGALADPGSNCWADCLGQATRGKCIFYAYILSIIDFHLTQPEGGTGSGHFCCFHLCQCCVTFMCVYLRGHLCASTWVHSVSVCLLGTHAHPHCCLDLETCTCSSKHHL